MATQSPLADTTSDFWRLVKDTGCVAIVMLNNVAANGNNNDDNTGRTDAAQVGISNIEFV